MTQYAFKSVVGGTAIMYEIIRDRKISKTKCQAPLIGFSRSSLPGTLCLFANMKQYAEMIVPHYCISKCCAYDIYIVILEYSEDSQIYICNRWKIKDFG